LLFAAQRLAAQPLGRFRFVVTILTGYPKSQSSVLSLSPDQVGCSRVLGHVETIIYFLRFIFQVKILMPFFYNWLLF
jgi:hypothetical protein